MYKPLQIEASQTLNVKSPLQGVGAGGGLYLEVWKLPLNTK